MTDMRSPAEIERDIQVTRAEIDRTLDRLERKLSPGHLLDTALDRVRDDGGAFAANLGRTARDNPMPVVLLGCSLAWLAFGQRAPSTHAHGGSGSNVLSDTGARISQGARQAGSAVHGAAEGMRAAGDRVSHTAQTMREQSGRYYRSANRMLHEHPLALGAMGLALGMTLAAVFPITRREEETMGEQADRVKDSVKEMATEQMHKADAAAGEAVKAVRQQTAPPDPQPREKSTEGPPRPSTSGSGRKSPSPRPAPGVGAPGPTRATTTPGSGDQGLSTGGSDSGKTP